MNDVRFPPRIVCKALDLSHGTISTWMKKGVIRNLDAQRTTKGKSREFTVADVLALALVKFAIRVNRNTKLIGHYAHVAAEDYITSGIRHLWVIHSDEKITIDYAERPADLGVAAVHFDLSVIFGDARYAILKAAAEIEEPSASMSSTSWV